MALATNAAKTFLPDVEGSSSNKHVREALSGTSTAIGLLMLSPFGFLAKLGETAGDLAGRSLAAIAMSSSFISSEMALRLQKLDTTVFGSGELSKFFERTVTELQDAIVSFANNTFQEGMTKDTSVL